MNRRTSLRRKTPMKRGTSELKRTPLAKKSAKQKTRDAIYVKVRREYLRIHRHCRVCTIVFGVSMRSSEIHHMRGRNGSLLWDTRYFAPTCRACREWPHDNPELARKLGLLASANDWGVVS